MARQRRRPSKRPVIGDSRRILAKPSQERLGEAEPRAMRGLRVGRALGTHPAKGPGADWAATLASGAPSSKIRSVRPLLPWLWARQNVDQSRASGCASLVELTRAPWLSQPDAPNMRPRRAVGISFARPSHTSVKPRDKFRRFACAFGYRLRIRRVRLLLPVVPVARKQGVAPRLSPHPVVALDGVRVRVWGLRRGLMQATTSFRSLRLNDRA